MCKATKKLLKLLVLINQMEIDYQQFGFTRFLRNMQCRKRFVVLQTKELHLF